MSRPIGASSPLFERIEALILAGERGELSAAEMEELDRLVRDDPQARRLYAQYIVETVDLHSWAACSDEGGFSSAFVGEDRRAESESTSGTTVPSAPQLSFLGDAWHGTVGYFSSGWPVAYLIGNGNFWGWAADRLSRARVPAARTGRQAIVDALATGAGAVSSGPDQRHGRLPVVERRPASVRLRWRAPRAPLQARLRPAGNHLRHRSQGRFCRARDV